ncbi:putative membrane protein [Pseudozyma hubeiensis]|nr:putative membrane protein [Pseudozyma hubeiensis]
MPPESPLTNGLRANRTSDDDDVEESAPLLATSLRKPTPLPLRPILILTTMRLAEPINFTIIFPFVNDLVSTLLPSVPPSSIGFYSGLIESLFSLSQTLTILFWGRLSDRIGRKPVLLMGLSGVAVSAILFGFGQSFVWIVLARAMAGATNGNVAIVKSVMAELTDESNQARAFGLLPLTWTVGCLVGPLLGGFLSRPAEKYPEIFVGGGWVGWGGVWERYPFLLPCVVSSAITLGSIGLGVVALEETLPAIVERKKLEKEQKEQRKQRQGEDVVGDDEGRGYGSVNQTHSGISDPAPTSSSPPGDVATCEPHPTAGIRELLVIPQIQKVMISYSFLALIAVALDAVFVLFLYEPVPLGGVGFTSSSTGFLLSINGLGGALVQLFLFPPLQQHYGTLRVYQLSMMAFPISVILLPLANGIARLGIASSESSHWHMYAVWTCLLVSTAIKTIGGMAFASNMILVNQCSTLTRGTALGTLNSLAQMASSVSRTAGPYFANTLFAFSVTRNLLGGQLVWLVLGVIGLVGPVVTLLIENLERPTRGTRSRR